MVDKVALGQAFSDYFGFPCQFSGKEVRRINNLFQDKQKSLPHIKHNREFIRASCTNR
jgi:hypothetical protein